MLNFSTPTVEDAEWAVPLAAQSDAFGCDTSFTNTFLWKHKYNIKICRYEDILFKRFGSGKYTSYSFPLGSGDMKKAVDIIIKDAEENGAPLTIGCVDEDKKRFLEENYPGKFEFENSRDSADYIYLRENLAELPGKKYQKKRNHISKFLRTYKNYSFEIINSSNASDALKVARGWCRLHGVCGGEQGLDDEFYAIRAAFDNYDALGLSGGILYVENEPVAMTVASEINSEICDINFEKALDFDGAYPMINREFAKTLTKYKYINREEDMGLEGLRKAKLSYHPDILFSKYFAKAVK